MAPRLFKSLSRWWHSPTIRYRILLTFGALFMFGGALALGAWFNVCAPVDSCPSIASLESYDPDQASKVYAADGRLVTDFGLTRRTVVPLKQISPALIAAVLATEDRRFYQHGGIDWYRVLGSVKALFSGRRLQGFSTITMQLARNLWPEELPANLRSGFLGVTRKLREARMALEIERNYKKDKILELYLNQINLGNGAYGVETAATRYFGKPARQLNVAEGAMLAAIPKAPTRYNPRRNPDYAVQRRNLIINLLRDQGKLTRESAEAWKAYPLALSSRSDFTGVGDYFVEYVRQLLQARFGSELYRSGLRVYTTLDLDMQQAAERALETQLIKIEEDPKAYGKFPHQTFRQYLDKRDPNATEDDQGPFSPYLQGAITTIEVKTGYIRALVGGRDFADSKYNRATQADRQAGSTFKPFVYAAALRAGYRLSDIYDDALVEVPLGNNQPPWAPKNYDNKFKGRMSMREGLYDSRNTVAVRVGLEVGVDAVVKEAAAAGISSRIPRVPSIFIGAAEVTPLEITSAFGTFANMGTRVSPLAILRVEDRAGNIIWQPESKQTRSMDPQHAWLILDGLRDVMRKGTAAGVMPRAGINLPAGGKTGTTNDGMDVWFIGFTPDLVTGVWMGFDRKQVIMSNAQGGRLAAPAWGAMMKDIYERRKVPGAWSMPEGLVAFDIDRSTGYLATAGCPKDQVGTEVYFPRDRTDRTLPDSPVSLPAATRLRLTADWVVPVTAPAIERGAVLLGDDGRIEAVGSAAAVPLPPGVPSLHFAGAALMPGLVNAHTHLELTGLAGQVEADDFPTWIRGVRQLKAGLDPEWFRQAARQGVRDAFAAGITTVLDTGDSGAVLPALVELGGAGVVYQEVFGPDPGQCPESLEGLRSRVAELTPSPGGRVALGVSPHAPYTVSGPLYQAVARFAADAGLRVAGHLAESEAESLLVTQHQGPFAEAWNSRGIPPVARHDSALSGATRSPVAWLDAHGVLGPDTLCIHTVRLDAADVAILAGRRVAIAHCPCSNARHGHGAAPLRDLLAAGLRVGVGTDSVISVGVLDLWAEIRAAAALAALTPGQALRLGTLEGARLVGAEAEVGWLGAGAFGDVIAVELPAGLDLRPVETRLLAAGPGNVLATFASGRPVYRRGAA